MFDQYRIMKVNVKFMPRQTQVTGDIYRIFHVALDHTDVTAPTAETDLLQYDNCRTFHAVKPFSVSLKPVVAQVVWQGVSASGYAPGKPGQWIDCKNAGVQHYGMKTCYVCNDTSVIDTYTDYWVEMREPN